MEARKTENREDERVVAEYAAMLYRIIFHYTGNRADTEDLVQEVFLAWVTGHPKFQDPEHEKAWLIRVAINKSKNHCHSAWRRLRSDAVEPEGISGDFTRQVEEADRLTRCLLRLPERYKPVLYLHEYEGYTLREIAAMLHLNEHTVESRLRRAKERLRKEWGSELDDDDL